MSAAPGLLRRLAAIAYDSLIVGALLIAAAAIALLFQRGAAVAAGTVWFQLALAGIVVGYFAWFWRRGGQTIGMVPWRLRVVTADGGRPSLAQCVARALAAAVSWGALGIGFLWVLVDRDGRGWHDLLSGTRLALDGPVSESARPPRQ